MLSGSLVQVLKKRGYDIAIVVFGTPLPLFMLIVGWRLQIDVIDRFLFRGLPAQHPIYVIKDILILIFVLLVPFGHALTILVVSYLADEFFFEPIKRKGFYLAGILAINAVAIMMLVAITDIS